MSTRYAVVLIPEPSFTARVYRARQLVCGQYATWAAEMHMLHLALTDYFPCPEEAVASVSAGLERVARQSREGVSLSHGGAAASPEMPGHIFLDFAPVPAPGTMASGDLTDLRGRIKESLAAVIAPDSGHLLGAEDFPAHIYLMQHASLAPGVLEGAVEFAGVVCQDLEIPETTRAWQLMLVRFQSAAAGDDWSGGRWAADLSWNIVSAHSF